MANYLLEIGLEDMPAHVVTPSLKQFAQKKRPSISKTTTWTLVRSNNMPPHGAWLC